MMMSAMAGLGGERDRDRGPRGDAGAATSLWIDYVLLPEKLEEYLTALAGGQVASPTPADLIAMFLEQAHLNQKASPGSSSAAIIKDGGPPSSATAMKTAAFLCERAARVAVAAGFSLLEIEASISSLQHQIMLLRALVKYDKCRLLIHECDLHRWILRNSLQSHPLGSAAPNATFSEQRAFVWALGEDSTDFLRPSDNVGGSDLPARNMNNGTKEVQLEEERPSVDFLEKVLKHEEKPCFKESGMSNGHCSEPECGLDTLPEQEIEACAHMKESLSTEGLHSTFMSKDYRCQIMMDVAEVHFMRGRIHKAHGLFTRCGMLAKSQELTTEPDRTPTEGVIPELQRLNSSKTGRLTPLIPTERLAGFIVACRMLLGAPSKSSSIEERMENLEAIGLDSSPLLGLGKLSAAQRMVIACEQSRYNRKRMSETPQTPTFRSAAKVTGEDDLLPELSKKKLKLSSSEEKLEDGANLTCLEVKMSDYQHTLEDSDSKTSLHQEIRNLETIVSNGNGHEGRKEKSGVSGVEPADHNLVVVEVTQSRGTIGPSPRKPFSEANDWRLTTAPTLLSEKTLLEGFDVKGGGLEAGQSDSSELLQVVVHDTLEGHLQWGYRISLARDTDIPVSLHCQLIACNVVRHIVERAPIQSFLEAIDTFRNNTKGINFLMSLMAAVKESFNGMTEVNHNGSVVEIQKTELLQNGQGIRGKSRGGSSIPDSEGLCAHISCSALYVCCVLDKSWCWEAALKYSLISSTDVPKILSPELPMSVSSECFTSDPLGSAEQRLKELAAEVITAESHGEEEGLKETGSPTDFLKVDDVRSTRACSGKPNVKADFKLEALLSALLHSESIEEIELLVLEAGRLCQAFRSEGGDEPVETISKYYGSASSKLEPMRIRRATLVRLETFPTEVAALLRRRAFNTLDILKQFLVAKRLCELARKIHPQDNDSMVMLWLLNKVNPEHGVMVRLLSLEEIDGEVVLDMGLVEYIIICLVEKELWNDLSELCQWGLSLVKEGKSVAGENVTEGAWKVRGIGVHIWHKRFAQTLKVAMTLGELMQLSSALLAATGRNHYTEDVAIMGSTMSQLFEDFLRLLVGADMEGPSKGGEDGNQLRGTHSGQIAPPPAYPGAQAVPLIPQLTSPRVLMSLASLTAGWLQRCNLAGLTQWPLSIERYGGLAAVTSGASLPPPVGSLPHAAGVFRPVPPRVAPEFGRDLFGVLLECIVALPGVVEGDKEKGHRWLQGLADLAFEDEAYVKALQLYLQAGGIRSAFYCDRSSAMPRDIFTPWVLRRMVQGCRAIGASVQAAVLCQCLPVPDHESAFRILQENSLIVVRDAVAYFDCVWEVPILELLVHMHSKSGDQERVSALITLLQQPALNVHNPQSIRLSHVASLEQRFLQRLCGELL